MSKEKAPELQRRVGLAGVVMFGAGTAIGVSIFSVLQPAAEVAGSGLLITIALSIVPMILFATVYAWMASILPTSGASYEWPRRFLGPYVGFAIAWMRIISNVGAMVILGRVLAAYLGMVLTVPALPIVLISVSAAFTLNLIGVTVAARAQVILMVILLAVLSLFVATGAPVATSASLGPLLAKGWPAIVAAIPLMISLFLGIESAVEIGDEVRDPHRTIPRGIAIAIVLTALVYGTVAAVALGVVGPDVLGRSSAPLLDAARVPLGRWATPLVVGAATISILKTMNATALVFSRSIFAMARTGALPPALARIHPRFHTPHAAIGACYLATVAGLLLPPSLVFLLLAINIPTMLKYMACSLCAVVIARNHTVLADRAGMGLRPGAIKMLGMLAAVVAIVIIAAGWEADWRPHVLVGSWLLIGTLLYLAYSRHRIAEASPAG